MQAIQLPAFLVENMKGISIPMTFIIFLILFLVIAVVLILWHFSGFDIFDKGLGNITHGMVNNTSGGVISGP